MKRKLFVNFHFINKAVIIFSIFFPSCRDYFCCDYLGTKQISEDVFIERYRTFCGGVWGGDVIDTYLTDKKTYRIKVGSEDDNNSFDVFYDNGLYYGVLYDYKYMQKTIRKDTFHLPMLSFSSIDTANFINLLPLVGDLLFDCNNHTSLEDDYNLNNSQYKVKKTQFQCDSCGTVKYYNAYYLINSKNEWHLMYNYDMDKWTKGKSHFDYYINENNLLIKEYETITIIDTLEFYEINLTEIKDKFGITYKSVCN